MSPDPPDTSLREFQFFPPSSSDFDDYLGSPENAGIPGKDHFPRLEADRSLRLIEDETQLGVWTASALHRGIMYMRGTPDDWAVGDGEWLREQLAGRGRIRVMLTTRRLFVSFSPGDGNQLAHECIIPPPRRGAREALSLTVKDRVLIGAASRLGRGPGAVGGFIRELIGDLPPIAGHLALEHVRAITWSATDHRTPVVVQAIVASPARRFEAALGPSDTKQLTIELHVSRSAARELGEALARAVHTRSQPLTESPLAMEPLPAPIPYPASDGVRHQPAFFQAIGADRTTVNASREIAHCVLQAVH